MKVRKWGIWLICFILVGCSNRKESMGLDLSANATEELVAEETIDGQLTPLGSGENSNSDLILDGLSLVEDMKVGWNLACSLNCSDYQKITDEVANQRRNYYQIMSIYETKQWSGWDASAAPYFSSDGSVELNWTITKINSKVTGQCGSFAIQIINNELVDSGSGSLKFAVDAASFKKADGTVIELTEFVNTYESSIKDKVTQQFRVDISQNSILKTSSDILNGTLTIKVKIKEYPEPKSEKVITATEYYETLYANPVTTKAMIDMVKEAGFNAVRVPITYHDHLDANGVIAEDWLNRIETVVNYILDNDMYCIINLHDDTGANGWLKADIPLKKEDITLFTKVWSQVAERFQDYDQRLIFESFNEMLNSKGEWHNAGKESYQALNLWNQIFVDTIRSEEGYNKTRFLTVTTYAAKSDEDILQAFQLPVDTQKNHLIVQVHVYEGLSEITSIFDRLRTHFVDKGIPVIVGEFGNKSTVDIDKRLSYVSYFLSEAKKSGITCFWWDDGGNATSRENTYNYALLNRWDLTWYYPDIIEKIIEELR